MMSRKHPTSRFARVRNISNSLLTDILVSLLSRRNTRGHARSGERAHSDSRTAQLAGFASRRGFLPWLGTLGFMRLICSGVCVRQLRSEVHRIRAIESLPIFLIADYAGNGFCLTMMRP